MNIKSSINELIGGTPLVRIPRMNDTGADIILKLEFFNPSGSVKDRAALAMLEDAKKRGVVMLQLQRQGQTFFRSLALSDTPDGAKK